LDRQRLKTADRQIQKWLHQKKRSIEAIVIAQLAQVTSRDKKTTNAHPGFNI